MSGIDRWYFDVETDDYEMAGDGDYVLHSDHEAEVVRLREARSHDAKLLSLADQNIASLSAEVEKNRVDAERYRWLRDTPWFDNYEIRSVIAHQQNALWDKTIDAAMGEGK